MRSNKDIRVHPRVAGFTGEVDDSGPGQRRLHGGALSANRLRNVEDRLQSLIGHLQTVNVVKNGIAVGDLDLGADRHDHRMRRILAPLLVDEHGYWLGKIASVLNAIEVDESIRDAAPLTDFDSRQRHIVAANFLMLFNQLDCRRRQRPLKTHDAANPACWPLVPRSSDIVPVFRSAAENKERPCEQYNQAFH